MTNTIKTVVNKEIVLTFLNKFFNKNISSIEFIHGGEQSQGFFFSVGNEEFVIRINKEFEPFEKDAYAYKHFSSNKLPIPEVIGLGKFNETYFYAITKRVNGSIVHDLSDEQFVHILPDLVDVLDAIHTRDISDTINFGSMNTKGKAYFPSWKGFILSVNDENWFHWKKVFEETFFEKEVFDNAYEKLKKLVAYCPEERFLLHGDFGGDNVISDGEKVTGVIDWGEAKYGDFLFDVAWMDFWNKQKIDVKKIFFNHYKEKNITIVNFDERVTSYQIWAALQSLYFYAISDQYEKYIWTRDRLGNILKDKE